MEKMTQNELEQYRKLQAKAKRIERAEKEFWKQVDERKEEILERFGVRASVSSTHGNEERRTSWSETSPRQSEVHLNAHRASSGTELLLDASRHTEA